MTNKPFHSPLRAPPAQPLLLHSTQAAPSVVLCVKCLLMPAFIVIDVSKCCTPDHLCYIQYYT